MNATFLPLIKAAVSAASPGINLCFGFVSFCENTCGRDGFHTTSFATGGSLNPEEQRTALWCLYPFRFILWLKVLLNAASNVLKSFPRHCCGFIELA